MGAKGAVGAVKGIKTLVTAEELLTLGKALEEAGAVATKAGAKEAATLTKTGNNLTKLGSETETASQKLLTEGNPPKLITERSPVPGETRFTGDKNGGLSDNGRGNFNTVEPNSQPIELPGPVPPSVQSRINLMVGDKKAGWTHVVDGHFNPLKNKSQFTISQSELRQILQSKEVVKTPISKILQSNDGLRYVREINLGKTIGIDKFSGNKPTSIITILTDNKGNLITATPGKVK